MHLRALDTADGPDALALYNELTFGPPSTDLAAYLLVLNHPGTTIIGVEIDDRIRAMVTLHILPNVTWDARPYALIENVITASAYRERGIGKAVMQHAAQVAWDQNAYKIMLLTGEKRGAQDFYRACGFDSEDKTAMVMRRP
ncbi:GNAT family N-acetyltransferase [Yoonia sp. 208BN28-4]|uniref:GNAT family N-acetyltransferase n=1 Tax=Yoonia sp. 208BN28-4 TaxID=3126505 RepID=UPI00309E5A11